MLVPISHKVNIVFMPHIEINPAGFKDSVQFQIAGKMGSKEGLNINFHKNGSVDPSTGYARDIPLHLNFEPGLNRYNFNSRRDDKWLTEIPFLSGTPIDSGEEFEMVIRPKESCFEIYVNEELLMTYEHKMPSKIPSDFDYIHFGEGNTGPKDYIIRFVGIEDSRERVQYYSTE